MSKSPPEGREGGASDRSLAQDMADAFAFSSASRPRSQDVGVSVSSGISKLLPVPCIKLGTDIGLNLGKAPGQHDIAAGRSANIAEVRKNADARKEISAATGAYDHFSGYSPPVI